MNFVQKISFFSTIVLFTILLLLLNRLSQESYCNQNPSISQLHIFNQGRIVKVPNCSLLDFSSFPTWTPEEQKLIAATQKISTLASPIMLTLDLQHPKKMRNVYNYFWVGSYFVNYFSEPLQNYLLMKSYSTYQGKNESEFITEVLNSLSVKVIEHKSPYFNWAINKVVKEDHLVNFLVSEKEYCEKLMLSLDNILDCINLKSEDENTLSLKPLEVIASEILFQFFKKQGFKEQLAIIENLKNLRPHMNFESLQILPMQTKEYSSLVNEITQISTQLIKLLSPDNLLNNEALAEVINPLTLFSERDYLIFSKKDFEPSESSQDLKHKFLRVDNNAKIMSRFGTSINLNLGQMYFENLLVENDKLNISEPVYKHARFVYVISSELKLKEIDQLGINGFLLNNKKISYAKVHIPSLNSVNIKNIAMKNIKDLAKSLGWEKVQWSKQKFSYLPKAKVDGVLSYR